MVSNQYICSLKILIDGDCCDQGCSSRKNSDDRSSNDWYRCCKADFLLHRERTPIVRPRRTKNSAPFTGDEPLTDVCVLGAIETVLMCVAHEIPGSNDQVERRGASPASNEGSLSRSSTFSLSHRSCGPRSLEPVVRRRTLVYK
jgi:hypothetical protein